MSYGVGHRRSLDLKWLWLWCRPEPPYMAGVALNRERKGKKSTPSLLFGLGRGWRTGRPSCVFIQGSYCVLSAGFRHAGFAKAQHRDDHGGRRSFLHVGVPASGTGPASRRPLWQRGGLARTGAGQSSARLPGALAPFSEAVSSLAQSPRGAQCLLCWCFSDKLFSSSCLPLHCCEPVRGPLP